MIARAAFNRLRDDVYVLACAIDDAEADLAGLGQSTLDADEVRRVLDEVIRASKIVIESSDQDLQS